jgi:hypothetical protein
LPYHHQSDKGVPNAVDKAKFCSSNSADANAEEMTDKGKYVSADLQTLIENLYILLRMRNLGLRKL